MRHFEWSLSVHYPDRVMKRSEFLDRVTDVPVEARENHERGSSHRVVIAKGSVDPWLGRVEASEDMDRQIKEAQLVVAAWFNRQDRSVFSSLRESGAKATLFYLLWGEFQDLDVELEAELMGAVAGCGVKIKIWGDEVY